MNPTTPLPSPVLELRQVTATRRFGAGGLVATDINWTVNRREFWILAGDQHAGKTDLLMLVAGLLPPGAGEVRRFGTDLLQLDENRLADRLRTGFVFEDGQLFPELTLLQNIALPLQYHRDWSAEEVLRTLGPLLERMDLTTLAGLRPGEVSRNWHKRAGLARALALEPELLLLDNPFHGLGVAHRQWWLRFLDEIARERGLTVVLTTDDPGAWAGDERRRFALLHEGRFRAAGGWTDFCAAHAGRRPEWQEAVRMASDEP